MKANNELASQTNFNLVLFKRVFIIIFLYIIAIDMVILIISFSFNVFQEMISTLIPIVYILFTISLIVKIGFEMYEMVRFVRFLKSDNREKEGANKIAETFLGTKIFGIYYLILLVIVIGFLELMETAVKYQYLHGTLPPLEQAFFNFYSWFWIFLAIHIFPLTIGSHLINFSIDTRNRENKIKVIIYPIIFIIVLIVLFNVDSIFLMITPD